MAPIEPDFSNSNIWPTILFWSYVSVTFSLIYLIVFRVIYRAHKSLPPSAATRHRQSDRWHHAQFYTGLALTSFCMAVYYNYNIVDLSLRVWYYERDPGPVRLLGETLFNYEKPAGVEWGRWLRETSLAGEFFELVVEKTRRRWWSQQLFMGATPWSLFVAMEGRRRNIPHLWAFLALAPLVSLSFAQALFFLTILWTPRPLTEHDKHASLIGPPPRVDHRRKHTRRTSKQVVQDAASTTESTFTTIPRWFSSKLPTRPSSWTPHPILCLGPIVGNFIAAILLPFMTGSPKFTPSILILLSNLFAPLALFYAPENFGKVHVSPSEARASVRTIFRWAAVLSFVLYWGHVAVAFLDIKDAEAHRHRHSSIFHRDAEPPSWKQGQHFFVKILDSVEDHPAVARIGMDVLLSGLGLGIWAYERGLEVTGMLSCVGLWSKWQDKAAEKVALQAGRATEKTKMLVKKAEKVVGRKTRGKLTSKLPPVPTKRPELIEDEEEEEDDEDYGPPGLAEEGIWLGDVEKEENAEAAALAWGMGALGGLGYISTAVLGAELIA